MAATGVRWWVAVPLVADGRKLGLLGFGLREDRGEPTEDLVGSTARSATAPHARCSRRS